MSNTVWIAHFSFQMIKWVKKPIMWLIVKEDPKISARHLQKMYTQVLVNVCHYKCICNINLKLRPVSGHSRPMCIFPPAQILLLADGHQSVMEFIVHSFYANRERGNLFNLLTVSKAEIDWKWDFENDPSHTPVIVGDIQVSVDGQESLFEEAYPLPLFLLWLVKDRLHFLHVARSITRHFLKNLLIAGSHLHTGICIQSVEVSLDAYVTLQDWLSSKNPENNISQFPQNY